MKGERNMTPEKHSGYDVFYRLLTFFGGYFLTAGFAVPISSSVLPSAPVPAIFATVLLCFAIGYSVQSLWCRIRGVKRTESDLSYESEFRYYRFGHALPVLALAGTAAALTAARLADKFLIESSALPGVYYDPDSVIPFLIAAVAAASVFVGSFSWFFPYDRMLTGKAAMAGLIISASGAVVFSVFSEGARLTTGICFIGYATVVQFAMNQANLGRFYKGAIGAVAGSRQRGYNLALTLLVFCAFLLSSAFFYVMIAGLLIIVRLFIALALSGSADINDPDSQIEANDKISALGDYIFRKNGRRDVSGKIYLVIFLAIFFVFIFYIITRKRNFMKTLTEKLKNLILFIIAAVFGPVADFFSPDMGNEFSLYYVDEEKKQDDVVSSGRHAAPARKKKSYRDFTEALKLRTRAEDKYRFAYSQLVETLKDKGRTVKDSDTPREISEKLRGEMLAVDGKTAKLLTDEFERIEYAGGTGASQEAFDSVCEIIIDNLENN
ncbi:MAG: DUF4129 domain-containing protein [Clostridia bacterium]|nr:DUF4129 domain-containing protein [Clostridia bacterium]